MPRTKGDWALRRVGDNTFHDKRVGPVVNFPRAVKMLRKEHQRAVRICKRLEREAIDRQEPDCTRCYLEGVRAVLAALTKGRA